MKKSLTEYDLRVADYRRKTTAILAVVFFIFFLVNLGFGGYSWILAGVFFILFLLFVCLAGHYNKKILGNEKGNNDFEI